MYVYVCVCMYVCMYIYIYSGGGGGGGSSSSSSKMYWFLPWKNCQQDCWSEEELTKPYVPRMCSSFESESEEIEDDQTLPVEVRCYMFV